MLLPLVIPSPYLQEDEEAIQGEGDRIGDDGTPNVEEEVNATGGNR